MYFGHCLHEHAHTLKMSLHHVEIFAVRPLTRTVLYTGCSSSCGDVECCGDLPVPILPSIVHHWILSLKILLGMVQYGKLLLSPFLRNCCCYSFMLPTETLLDLNTISRRAVNAVSSYLYGMHLLCVTGLTVLALLLSLLVVRSFQRSPIWGLVDQQKSTGRLWIMCPTSFHKALPCVIRLGWSSRSMPQLAWARCAWFK